MGQMGRYSVHSSFPPNVILVMTLPQMEKYCFAPNNSKASRRVDAKISHNCMESTFHKPEKYLQAYSLMFGRSLPSPVQNLESEGASTRQALYPTQLGNRFLKPWYYYIPNFRFEQVYAPTSFGCIPRRQETLKMILNIGRSITVKNRGHSRYCS